MRMTRVFARVARVVAVRHRPGRRSGRRRRSFVVLSVVGALVAMTAAIVATAAPAAATDSYDTTFTVGCGDTAALIADFEKIAGTDVSNTTDGTLSALSTPTSYHIVLGSNCNYVFDSSYDGADALPAIGGDITNQFLMNYLGGNGDPGVAYSLPESVTIDGNGSTFTRTGSAPFRFLGVDSSAASLTVNNLTLTGGQAPDGTHVANHDWWKYVLSIATQIIVALATDGASSWLKDTVGLAETANVTETVGALDKVLNVAGTLNDVRSAISALDKGVMAVVNDVGPVSPGGNGGAIASDGALTLNNVNFQSNRAGDGGNGADASGENGAGGGSGGAVYVSPTGSLAVTGSTFTGNHAGQGGTGSYGATPFTSGGGTGGDGGDGGAIASFGPTTINGSMFSQNLAGAGGAPGENWGVATSGGHYGDGGAVLLGSSIQDSTIDASSFVRNGNLAGGGGAIATVAAADAFVTNSTFLGNNASIGGELAALDTYGSVSGSGTVASYGNAIDVRNSTFDFSAHAGSDGNLAYASAGDSVTISNSVRADGAAGKPDCAGPGTITTHTYYISSQVADTSCVGAVPASPSKLLDSATTSIGVTVALRPVPGSVLLDAGDPAYCTAYDQRGLPRAAGACDIGAIDHFQWTATSLGTLYASAVGDGSAASWPWSWPNPASWFEDQGYLVPVGGDTRVMSGDGHVYFFLPPTITVAHAHYVFKVFLDGHETDITTDHDGDPITDPFLVPLVFDGYGNATVELWVVDDAGEAIKLDSKSFAVGNSDNTAPTLSIDQSPASVDQYSTVHYTVTVTDPDAGASWTFSQVPDCDSGNSSAGTTTTNLTTTPTSFSFDCNYGQGAPDGSSTAPHAQLSLGVIDDQGAPAGYSFDVDPAIDYQPATFLPGGTSTTDLVYRGPPQTLTFRYHGDHTELESLASDLAANPTPRMHCGTYLDLVAGSVQVSVDGTTLTGSFQCTADQPAGIGQTVSSNGDATWFSPSGAYQSPSEGGDVTVQGYDIRPSVDITVDHPVYTIQGSVAYNESINLGVLNDPDASGVASTTIDWGDGTGPQTVSSTGWTEGTFTHDYTTAGLHPIVVSVTLDDAGLAQWNSNGNDADASTKITLWQTDVLDSVSAAPVITVPADLTLTNASTTAATLHYVATATDPWGPVPVRCSTPDATVLPVGRTTVTCSATSGHAVTATAAFHVTVLDVQPPVLGEPTVNQTTTDGATTVTYTVPVTDDATTDVTNDDPAPTLACDHPSGSVFLAGATTVTCTATDAGGNKSSESFLVNVGNGSGPSITVPSGPTATSPDGNGVAVDYSVSASDQLGAAVTPSCLPASGSVFAPGTTTVTCTATDGNGNWSSANFPVLVYGGTVSNWNDLQAEFDRGGQSSHGVRTQAVKLGVDITELSASDGSGQSLQLAAGDVVTLDLAGHALDIDAPAGQAGIGVPAGAQLTIIDSSADHTGTLTVRAQGGGAAIGGALCRSAGDVVIGPGVHGTAVSAGGDGVGGGAAIGAGASLTSDVIATWGIDSADVHCDDPLSGGSATFTGSAYDAAGTTAGSTDSAPGATIDWAAPTGGQPREAIWPITPSDTGADGGIGFTPSGWLTVDLQGGSSATPLGGPLAVPSQLAFTKASLNPDDVTGNTDPGVDDPTNDGYYFGGWRAGSTTGDAWSYDPATAATDPASQQDLTVYASWIPVTVTGGVDQLAVPAGGNVLLDSRGQCLTFGATSATGPGIEVPVGATLTITDTAARCGITAHGGPGAAGIGGGSGEAAGTVVVTGAGNVSATGQGGAGVGGGAGAAGGAVVLRGGFLQAISDSGAEVGAGSGYSGSAPGTLTVYGSLEYGTWPANGGGGSGLAATFDHEDGPGSLVTQSYGQTLVVEYGYDVTYHLNGGQVDPTYCFVRSSYSDGATIFTPVTGDRMLLSVLTQQTCDQYGNSADGQPLMVPPASGESFAGWYTNPGFTHLYATFGSVTPPVLTGDTDLYAKWGAALPNLTADQTPTLNTGDEDQVWMGKTLTVTPPSSWNGGAVAPGDVTVQVQWLRGGVPIRDATGTSYVLKPADVGSLISVQLTATASGYDAYSWTRSTAGSVGPGTLVSGQVVDGAFVAGQITRTGFEQPQVGNVLSVPDLAWQSLVDGTDYVDATPTVHYVWERGTTLSSDGSALTDGTPIAGAPDSPSYTVQGGDIGYRIAVVVTASLNGYQADSFTGGVSGLVLSSEFPSTPTPTITVPSSCTPVLVGSKCWLTADPGSWGAVPGLQLSYEWDEGVPGGTRTQVSSDGNSMPSTLNTGDVTPGDDVWLTVTATAPGYNTVQAVSDPLFVDGVNFVATSKPTIQQLDGSGVGGLLAGDDLQASDTPWDPVGTMSWQWYLRDSAGDLTPIDGATYQQITINAAWAGDEILVTLTGSLPGYYPQTTSSTSIDLPVSETVHFDSAGGTAVADEPVVQDTAATAPTPPTRDGYTFAGWYDAQGNAWDFDEVVLTETTLTAHWATAPASYTVSFDANGGSGAPGAQTVTSGGTVTEPDASTDPTRVGYTFTGWYTTATDGTEFDFTTPITSDLTLYAHWTPVTYTVAFDPNGGTGAPTNQSVNYDGTATTPTTDPTRVGYVFTGWYTTATDGTEFDFTTPITSDLTLYAHWSATSGTPTSYTVSFDANGGTGGPAAQTVASGDTATAPDAATPPTWAGHTFVGWYTEAGTNGAVYLFTTPVTGDVTLYAHWTPISYTVTFDPNGGTGGPTNQSVDYDGTATTPTTDPTRDGYTFAGWYTEAGTNGAVYVFTTPITGDVTLYAHWTPVTYTVAFDANGGTGVPSNQSVDYGSTATTPTTDPTWAGHTFAGWYTTATDGTEFDFTTPITSDLTLYAHWTATPGTPSGSGGSETSGSGSSPVTTTVSAGGSASSSTDAAPSAATPVIATVTSPTDGTVTFTPGGTGADQDGYTMLGQSFTITAPAATASRPLILVFGIDQDALSNGADSSPLTVFRDGVAIRACATADATTADPDPCVTSSVAGDGITTVTVLSSHASTWTFGTTNEATPSVSQVTVAAGRAVDVGGRQRVAIRVRNSDGTLAANTAVQVAVTGSNPASGTAVTGAHGELANFYYTPTHPGSDTITVTVDGHSASTTVTIGQPRQRPVLAAASKHSGTVNVAVQTRPAVTTRTVKIYYVDKVHGRKAQLRYAGYAVTNGRGRAHAVLTLTPGRQYVLRARMADGDYVEQLSNRYALRVRR